jgi:hypothetical protein
VKDAVQQLLSVFHCQLFSVILAYMDAHHSKYDANALAALSLKDAAAGGTGATGCDTPAWDVRLGGPGWALDDTCHPAIRLAASYGKVRGVASGPHHTRCTMRSPRLLSSDGCCPLMAVVCRCC